MASFHEDAVFPTGIAKKSTGGPRFSTSIHKLRSGAEERVARWTYPLHAYDARYGVTSPEKLTELLTFFIARLGPAHGFRWKDFSDYSTDTDHTPDQSAPAYNDVEIGTGDGSTTTFQLVKKYTSGGVTRTRTISKPIAGTVKSGVNGVEKTITTHWTINTTTGVITYGTAPPLGHSVTAGFDFHVPCRFHEDLDEGFLLSWEAFRTAQPGAIPIIEDFQAGRAVADEYPYGGSDTLAFGVDVEISANYGRSLTLLPSTGGLTAFLPDSADLEDGGPWFFLFNGEGDDVDIADAEENLVGTLAADSGATVVLATVSGSKVWYMF